MNKKTRRHHTPEDKVRILRLHLLEGRPISEICEAEGIHPTLFYQWQKTFFEKGTAAFENGRSPSRVFGQTERKLEALEKMIKLLHVLLQQYRDQERLFLSWDAASWHASKTFLAEVAQVNCSDYRNGNKSPAVVLAPLPACAQYLNVIESVFSGMARAIIHNSDYESVAECMDAIDLYYSERNQHFKSHPKRAGHKIWGQEREPPVFSESNNCKDPRYQ